ncbi:MAG: hypothetical protein FWG99_04755 [Treponema sp.]|nr:hypothetical protein [Treponema sp.]
MKDITEYNNGTSEFELFSLLYDKIISKEIVTFSKLKEYVAPVVKDKAAHPAIIRAFELIKRLNWGFFRLLGPQTHKKLWREMVISDKDFPEAGDLKKTLQISNLYVAMLDIHGYTKFCMESRKNLSMMHTLDWAIENEVRRISTLCGAISQRERGDEIVVVAASATDAIMVTLCIIDYFSKTEVVQDPHIPTKRTGNAEALPAFKISAGITGGNTQSPLIITERGNLAGFLLNSGARLQTRANELSPKESRVMIAKQVQMNYQKENTQTKCLLMKKDAVYFFDTGHIEFKGVMIPTCEVVFNKDDRYKERFGEEMTKLFGSIRENLWEQRIYLDMMELLSKVFQVMPKFSVTPREPVHGMQTITDDSCIQLCRYAIKAYIQDEDYDAAVGFLHDFYAICEQLPSFDRLILDYLKGIIAKYDFILETYNSHMDHEVDEKASQIFQGNYYKTWLAAKNGAQIFEKLKTAGRKSNDISKKKSLWFSLIKQKSEQMEFTLYSGKK